MTTLKDKTLADLAVTRPAASQVFRRHGLDFCCSGRRPLAAACAARRARRPGHPGRDRRRRGGTARGGRGRLADAPAAGAHRLHRRRYHARLREELPELIELADKVEQAHAAKASCPRGLADLLRQVHLAVLDHLAKEEQILFPLIVAGAGRRTAPPIQVMEHEHRDHGAEPGPHPRPDRRPHRRRRRPAPPGGPCTCGWRPSRTS